MNQNSKLINRRRFLQTSAITAVGAGTFSVLPVASFGTPGVGDNVNIIGPVDGYSPHIGILVSMMNWMRATVEGAVKDLKQSELDFLLDPKGNTIGALLMHLSAIEVAYQDRTLFNLKGFSDENRKRWIVAANLGDEARKQIKGHDLDYYLSAIKEVREKTLTEFKKRDDKWFAEIDASIVGRPPRNNFCKWFHVCEHEANHRGQITMIKKRLPGKETEKDS